MKRLITILVLLPVLAFSQQTAQLNFKYKNGTMLGKWQVLDLPTKLFTYSIPQGQLLIYYPPAYYQGKRCGIGIWQGGKGELTSLDITEVYKNSFPGMIQNGLVPYSILPNKDTLWHILACIHSNIQGAYRDPLRQIIPWILDSAKNLVTGKPISYDPAYVWASGLSEGGSGTWAVFMVDSLLSKRVHYNVAMANGGYDNNLAALSVNLLAACNNGVFFLPYIGTQDPGYNPGGFLAYDAFLKAHALSGHYFPHVITNGTHSANVWDVPWKSQGFWDTLGMLGYTAPAPAIPRVKARILVDSLVIHYPTTSVMLTDSSVNSYGGTWDFIDYPKRPIQTGAGIGHMILSGLVPGVYTVGVHVYGDGNTATSFTNEDSARVQITVLGPPACPPPPAPRKVVSVQVPLFGALITVPLDQAIIKYDDGNP